MPKVKVREIVLKQGARLIAVFLLLYFLSAFIQTGFISLREVIVGTLWLLLLYILSRRLDIITVLTLTFAASVMWGLFIESVPASDFLTYHNHSTLLSSGEFSELFSSKSPATVAYFAVFHWLLGTSHLTNYIASAAAWTGGAAIVYKSIRPFFLESWKAKFVCFGLALCPAFLVFSPLIGSEAVFFLLSALCAWLISKHLREGDPVPYLYVVMGIVSAALFLTRATGVFALLICLAVTCVSRAKCLGKVDVSDANPDPRRSRHPLALSAIVLMAFFLVWFAHGELSRINGLGFEVTPSPWGTFSLLFGTNFDSKGRFNREDIELVGYDGKGAPPSSEQSSRALKIARERMVSNPVRFLRFALTDKVGQLWSREHSLYYWAVGPLEKSEVSKSSFRQLAFVSLDGVYRLTFLLFLVLLIKEIHRPSYVLIFAGIALLFSLPHLFFEVQPRYHLAMTPFMIVGSLLFILSLYSRREEWFDRARSTVQRVVETARRAGE